MAILDIVPYPHRDRAYQVFCDSSCLLPKQHPRPSGEGTWHDIVLQRVYILNVLGSAARGRGRGHGGRAAKTAEYIEGSDIEILS